jgi:hypothetical protein
MMHAPMLAFMLQSPSRSSFSGACIAGRGVPQ